MPPPATLCSAIGSVALDVDLAERICLGILNGSGGKPAQFRALFSAYPEISRDDVKQEMMLAICRQWCGYDPGKSAPQTFTFQRARSAMIDLARRCASGKGRVKRAAAQMKERDFWHHDPDPAEADRPLDEMLADNLKAARRIFGKRKYRRGRRYFNMPQLIAIAMLMRQRKIGNRRCRRMLLERPELREALKLGAVPSRWTLMDTAVVLRNFEREAEAKPDGVPDGRGVRATLPRPRIERIEQKPRRAERGRDIGRTLSHPLQNFTFAFGVRTTGVA